MGGKKRPARKKGSGDDDEDISTELMVPMYRKKCKDLKITSHPAVLALFNDALDNGEEVKNIFLSEIGDDNTKALMMGLKEVKIGVKKFGYVHATEINMVKCLIKDEGAKSICDYLTDNKTIKTLNLTYNLMQHEGAGYIGKLLFPGIGSPLETIILDYCPIGSLGVALLCNGFNTNAVLTSLSLGYCSIDSKGAEPLSEALCFINSALESLNLEGNFLKNEGVIALCPGLTIAKSLKEINLVRNEFGEDRKVLDALTGPMSKNSKLRTYRLHDNGLNSQETVTKLMDIMKAFRNVSKITINDKLNKDNQKELKKLEKENKPKGKKKKGKKGKKKKK